jgi:glycosyltransferase involved in cell wall biosynthesis
MKEAIKKFENVTLLITHYNRSKSLERLLETFSKSGCSFFETIVSDDGSKAEHIEYIKEVQSRFEFTLLTTPKNRGLGNNINKGQDAVKTEFTLYVQEDFIPLQGFCTHFQNGLNIFESDKEVDSVRFYSYLNYPNLKPFKNGFSEMIFDPWSLDLDKVPMYSDHPHLRRSNFFEKFGRYSEIKSSDQTEYDMMISFLKKKSKAYLFADYKAIFEPVNSSEEPSMVTRNYWRNTDNMVLSVMRTLYRHLKFNYRYFLKK